MSHVLIATERERTLEMTTEMVEMETVMRMVLEIPLKMSLPQIQSRMRLMKPRKKMP
jgi:hypothetical protein